MRTTIASWQAEGVQPPPKIVPTPPCPLPAKHEKIPQLPLIKPKCSGPPTFATFLHFSGSPLVGQGGGGACHGFPTSHGENRCLKNAAWGNV